MKPDLLRSTGLDGYSVRPHPRPPAPEPPEPPLAAWRPNPWRETAAETDAEFRRLAGIVRPVGAGPDEPPAPGYYAALPRYDELGGDERAASIGLIGGEAAR